MATQQIILMLTLLSLEGLLARLVAGPRSSYLDGEADGSFDIFYLTSEEMQGDAPAESSPSEIPGSVTTENERPPGFSKPEKMHKKVLNPSGSFARLKCQVDAFPTANITWVKDDEKLKSKKDKFVINNWSLKIDKLTTEDSGNYTCIVCNKLGCINYTYNVDVIERFRHRPYIKEHFPLNVTVLVGGRAKFECPTVSDLEPFIQWLRLNSWPGPAELTSTDPHDSVPQGELLQTSSDAYLNPEVYQLDAITLKDEGWYMCVAGNALGVSRSAAYLKVIDPSALKGSASSLAAASILASLLALLMVTLL